MERHCIKCGTDLTDRMGMYVFVMEVCSATRCEPADDVQMCLECGNNGHNGLSQAEYDAMPYRKA